MPATGRRELDEGYKPLAFEELAAVYRTLTSMERLVLGTPRPLTQDKWGLFADLDRVRSALTRIKFITPEDQA